MPIADTFLDDLDQIEQDLWREPDVPLPDLDFDAEDERLVASVASFLGYGRRLPEVER